MRNWKVIIEDTVTSKRYARIFLAAGKDNALRLAYQVLSAEQSDYHVVSIEPTA